MTRLMTILLAALMALSLTACGGAEETPVTRQIIAMDTAMSFSAYGETGDEAVQAVTYFLDDAVVCNVHQLRVLHGTGNGILRTLVRQYLSTVPFVHSFHDEHVQFGGAGITVIELDK